MTFLFIKIVNNVYPTYLQTKPTQSANRTFASSGLVCTYFGQAFNKYFSFPPFSLNEVPKIRQGEGGWKEPLYITIRIFSRNKYSFPTISHVFVYWRIYKWNASKKQNMCIWNRILNNWIKKCLEINCNTSSTLHLYSGSIIAF